MLEVARERRREEVICFNPTEGMGRMGRASQIEASVIDGVVKFSSTRFGELSVAEDKIIAFPNGVLGIPDAKKFIILDYEGEVPFKWLQSVDDPALAFLVAIPTLIKPDYLVCLNKAEIADIGECKDEDIVIFTILTVPEGNPKGVTANLRGPIVINSATMRGKQIILQDERYAVRHPVFS